MLRFAAYARAARRAVMTVARTGLAVAISLAASGPAGADPAPRQLPDYGVMLNEDGDVVFANSRSADPAEVKRLLRGNLDCLLDTPVRTLVFNVACGSDVMHYPTEVGSRWGWRYVQKEESKPWATYMPAMRAASAAGLDSVRIAAEWARDHGRLFVPAYRINDSHYAHEPEHNPLAGRFYMENRGLELGESPVPGDTSFARLLDFERAEVRAYRLGVMLEVIERYGDVMDGFEIDFMRQPILFKRGRASSGETLLTQMIREVRDALTAAERRHGRTIGFIVRVPPSPANCTWSGLAVGQWMREGLIDVVIPSPGMTLAHDIRYDEFKTAAGDSGVKIGSVVLPRTQFTWPMVRQPSAETYTGVVDRAVSPAQVRAAVNNAVAAGAELTEFYNVNLPLDDLGRSLVLAAASPLAGDRVYAVTPAYYLDHTDTYEYRKQIPFTMTVGKPVVVDLYCAEEPHGSGDRAVQLRIGLRAADDAVYRLRVELNGSRVYEGSLDGPGSVPVTGKRTRPSNLHPPDPQRYLHVPISDTSALRQGSNRLAFSLASGQAGSAVEVVEVQLAVFED